MNEPASPSSWSVEARPVAGRALVSGRRLRIRAGGVRYRRRDTSDAHGAGRRHGRRGGRGDREPLRRRGVHAPCPGGGGSTRRRGSKRAWTRRTGKIRARVDADPWPGRHGQHTWSQQSMTGRSVSWVSVGDSPMWLFIGGRLVTAECGPFDGAGPGPHGGGRRAHTRGGAERRDPAHAPVRGDGFGAGPDRSRPLCRAV